MILGIGIDIVEIQRIQKAIQNVRFLEKCFCQEERDGIHRVESFAGNFAAKEAAAKALGIGFRGFCPGQIAVLRDEFGKPYIRFYGKAKERAEQLGVTCIHVTISHEKYYAIANVILE